MWARCNVGHFDLAHLIRSGGLVDGPRNGVPPGPWEIPVQSTGFFKTETLCVEVDLIHEPPLFTLCSQSPQGKRWTSVPMPCSGTIVLAGQRPQREPEGTKLYGMWGESVQ